MSKVSKPKTHTRTAGDSRHSYILNNESSFIFEDERNCFRHYLMLSPPSLKGSENTEV